MSACPFDCLSALPFHACLSVYLSAYPSACMPACLLAYLTVSHSKCVHACLCACVRVCLCACLPVCLHVCLPGCLLLFACFVYAFPLHLLNEFFFLFTSQITHLVLHQTQIVKLFGDINYREFKARYLENDEHFIYFRHSRLVT